MGFKNYVNLDFECSFSSITTNQYNHFIILERFKRQLGFLGISLTKYRLEIIGP